MKNMKTAYINARTDSKVLPRKTKTALSVMCAALFGLFFSAAIPIAAMTLTAACALVFGSCAHTAVKSEQPDPDFLGDFDPIRLEDVMALRNSFGKIKPAQLRMYFVPRTNIVEVHLRDGANAFVLMFDQSARQTLREAISLYAQAYERYGSGEHKAMEVRKPTAKNAFNRGPLSVAWGVLGTARSGSTHFRTNYEFLEKGKPYFLFTAEPADDRDASDVQSPALKLYFSPSQLETLLAVIDEQALRSEVDTLNEKAFTF